MPPRRGVLLFILLLVVVGGAVFMVALNLRGPSTALTRPTVLVFRVPTDLEESERPFRPVPFRVVHGTRTTVYSVVNGLLRAAEDDRVSALVLHIDEIDWGWAKLTEVRDALQRFQSAGKPIYASLAGAGDAEYYLASVADTIGMPPSAILELNGLTESVLYLRGAFDKLGISPNYAQAGEFKSAVETYTRTGMSPAARRALDTLLDDEYGLLVDSLGVARGLTTEAVRGLLDGGPYVAKEAVAHRLVDTLLYDAEVDSLAFRSLAGRGLTALSFTRYAESLSPERDGPHIALIDAAGTIMPGKSRFTPSEGRALGSETLIEALRQARQRRSIKAVVLRVDSPGGSLQASDDIWREMEACRRTKPLIVSMSDLAASGGYYIALPADRIVAQPSTLTGSIGVYGGKLNILGLFHKLGINIETLSRGKHAEMFSPFHDFTPDEAEHFQHQLDEGYRLFLSRVAAARRLSMAATDSVSQGRVWSGAAARRLGLVDSLGGMEVAFGMALERAGYKRGVKFAVDRLPKVEHPFFEGLLEDWLTGESSNGNEDSGSLAGLRLSTVLEAWQAAAQFPAGAPLALTPYQIVIR